MKNHKKKRGFTLIEMLMVVGIIIVLASMVISVATRATNQALPFRWTAMIIPLTAVSILTLEQR